MPETLAGWLAYLEKLHPKSIALGLERVDAVRRALQMEPVFPIVTVAGTNGKGSTCAMLEQIYREAGYRVACYTSPHLLRYNERVRIDGREADDASLCRAFAAVEAVRHEIPLTYFEFGTLAAMWLFIEASVEVAILEVGLGGRLDAVNIFEPQCAVLTSVDIDHIDFLGDSRESIGQEKAGIFRKGVPAICGDMQPPATVLNVAAAIGARYRQSGVDFGFIDNTDNWTFFSGEEQWPGLPKPALNGAFQLLNASCVLEAVRCLQAQLPVSASAIWDGLQHVLLQGRFQRFPGPPEVILDVAHNPHAARSLAENLRGLPFPCSGRTLAVFAMLADKDIAGVVEALAPAVDAWFVADIDQPRGASGAMLATILTEKSGGKPVSCHRNVISAYRQACLSAGENDRIAAFGSFYTVADVLQALPTDRPAV